MTSHAEKETRQFHERQSDGQATSKPGRDANPRGDGEAEEETDEDVGMWLENVHATDVDFLESRDPDPREEQGDEDQDGSDQDVGTGISVVHLVRVQG
jgi:hypothetical protein